jgi:hypothetical protein
MIEKRRNGKYTCLDCKKSKSKFCLECKNWHLFELDEELIKLSYTEKSERYLKKEKS